MKPSHKRKVVPTTRDTEIKLFVHRGGWFNGRHICKAIYIPGESKNGVTKHFNVTSSQCVSRLKILSDPKYGIEDLERTNPLFELGKGSDPFIYSCAKKLYGVDKKTGKEGLLHGKPYISPPNVRNSDYLHDRIVRDLFTDVVVAARIAAIRMVDWKSDYTLLSENPQYHADWYWSLQVDEGMPFMSFLEFQRTEVSRQKWESKVEGINDFFNSPLYQQIYGHNRVRWYIVGADTPMTKTLLKWTEEYLAGKRKVKQKMRLPDPIINDSRFWFTDLNSLTPFSALTIPIWQVAGQEGLHHATKLKK